MAGKDKKYFDDNVIYGVEVEYDDGYRLWKQVVGYNLKSVLDDIEAREDEGLSDVDYSTHQPDEWCRKVLNTANLNFFKNQTWCKKHNLKSFDEVINYIIEKQLV